MIVSMHLTPNLHDKRTMITGDSWGKRCTHVARSHGWGGTCCRKHSHVRAQIFCCFCNQFKYLSYGCWVEFLPSSWSLRSGITEAAPEASPQTCRPFCFTTEVLRGWQSWVSASSGANSTREYATLSGCHGARQLVTASWILLKKPSWPTS